MICERTHENILKQWGNFFQNNWKCLEVFIFTNGPSFINPNTFAGLVEKVRRRKEGREGGDSPPQIVYI